MLVELPVLSFPVLPTGVSASLTSCSALREQLQASAALCETQRLQIDGLAADLQRLQLQVHASASAVPIPVSHSCKIVVHGFAQGASDKHAYTVLFTEFLQNTLCILNVPFIKVQQLRPSCCTQNGLSFAVYYHNIRAVHCVIVRVNCMQMARSLNACATATRVVRRIVGASSLACPLMVLAHMHMLWVQQP